MRPCIVLVIEVLGEQIAEQLRSRDHGADARLETLHLGWRDAGVEPFAHDSATGFLVKSVRRLGDHDLVGTGFGFVGEADGLRQDVFFHGMWG